MFFFTTIHKYTHCFLHSIHLIYSPYPLHPLTRPPTRPPTDRQQENDCTSLFYVARSLMKLQCMFGLIPNVKGKGECAQQVKDMMLRMRREMGGDEPTLAPEIDTLILIDRQVDMVSPMATQLTYEGLIDEVFGISNGFVYLDPDFLPQPGSNQSSAAEHKQQQQQKKKSTAKVPTPLNSNDEVYNQIRDQNFSVVGPRLNAKAREIKAYYEVCVLCVCV
jgi:vacuolar protein sorting-associated protein 33A